MRLDGVNHLARTYIALGNRYANRSICWLEPLWHLAFSAVALVFVLGWVMAFSCPDRVVQWGERAVMAGAAAGLISPWFQLFSGNHSHMRGLVFWGMSVIVFVVQPLGDRSASCEDCQISGKVIMSGRPLANVLVRCVEDDRQVWTDDQGEFRLHFPSGAEDSLCILLTYQTADTSICIQHSGQREWTILWPDTIPSLTRTEVRALVKAWTTEYQQQIEACLETIMLQRDGRLSSLKEIIEHYQPYDEINTTYRNEFEFQGPGGQLQFKANLVKAGIIEVEPPEPYLAHHLEDHKALLIAYARPAAAEFRLHYALVNNRPLGFRCQLERQRADRYEVHVYYSENIRAVEVLLERSARTDWHKKRLLRFYGHLPDQHHVLVFEREAWKLKPKPNAQ